MRTNEHILSTVLSLLSYLCGSMKRTTTYDIISVISKELKMRPLENSLTLLTDFYLFNMTQISLCLKRTFLTLSTAFIVSLSLIVSVKHFIS